MPVVSRALADKVGFICLLFFWRTSLIWQVTVAGSVTDHQWLCQIRIDYISEEIQNLTATTMHDKNDDSLTITLCFTFMLLSTSEARHIIHTIYACNLYRCLCPCQFVCFYNFTRRTKTLISIFLLFCSVVQCSITVLPTKKVKASHPLNRVTFQPHGALKSDSKHETHFLYSFKHLFSLWESAGSLLFMVSASSCFITETLSPLSSASVKKYGFLPAAYTVVCVLIQDLATVNKSVLSFNKTP